MRPSVLWLLVLVGCSKADAPGDDEAVLPAEVTCVPTTPTQVDDIVELVGVIAPPPKFDAVISSPVAGRVVQLTVEEGDKVAAGALLATIDDPSLPANAIEAQAGVSSARAAAIAAQQDLARQQHLVTAGIGARRDLDEAQAKAASAEAELAAANARSGMARRANAHRELRAPHAGVVLHLWKRIGESVDGTSATPVAEVADVTTLEVRAQLPAASLVAVKEGMAATVRLAGIEGDLAAKVVRVAPAVDPSTLLETVRIQLLETRAIAIGSPASATIRLAQRQGVLVPSTAVRRSLVGDNEVVVCEQGVAHVRSVTVRHRDEGTSEVLVGLTAADHIVVDHVLGIEEGQPLTVQVSAPKK